MLSISFPPQFIQHLASTFQTSGNLVQEAKDFKVASISLLDRFFGTSEADSIQPDSEAAQKFAEYFLTQVFEIALDEHSNAERTIFDNGDVRYFFEKNEGEIRFCEVCHYGKTTVLDHFSVEVFLTNIQRIFQNKNHFRPDDRSYEFLVENPTLLKFAEACSSLLPDSPIEMIFFPGLLGTLLRADISAPFQLRKTIESASQTKDFSHDPLFRLWINNPTLQQLAAKHITDKSADYSDTVVRNCQQYQWNIRRETLISKAPNNPLVALTNDSDMEQWQRMIRRTQNFMYDMHITHDCLRTDNVRKEFFVRCLSFFDDTPLQITIPEKNALLQHYLRSSLFLLDGAHELEISARTFSMPLFEQVCVFLRDHYNGHSLSFELPLVTSYSESANPFFAIADLISGNPNLTKVSLQGVLSPPEIPKDLLVTFDVSALASALKTNLHITDLQLVNCTIRDKDQPLTSVVTNHKSLKNICLQNSGIELNSALALMCNSNLSSLELQENSFNQVEQVELLKTLNRNTTLTSLKLNWADKEKAHQCSLYLLRNSLFPEFAMLLQVGEKMNLPTEVVNLIFDDFVLLTMAEREGKTVQDEPGLGQFLFEIAHLGTRVAMSTL